MTRTARLAGMVSLTLLLAACTGNDEGPVATATVEGSPSAAATSSASATAEPTPEATPEPTATAPLGPFEGVAQSYPVPPGSGPHDVAPAVNGGVWYTAQRAGALGHLGPVTGDTRHIPLGAGSAPHGVIVGPDGAAWVTDSGLNAMVRVDAVTDEVTVYPLPGPRANLNTAAFDGRGRIWFTGQAGYYGRLDPATGDLAVFDAPRGRGPYGIAATPGGEIYYASLAGNHIAHINLDTDEATVIEPPTAGQGARRVWSDSQGNIWVSEWNSGQVSRYTPSSGAWAAWRLPGESPQAYSVYVDERDAVWLTDFRANAVVRFDPVTEEFVSFLNAGTPGNVRQMLGRPAGRGVGARVGERSADCDPVLAPGDLGHVSRGRTPSGGRRRLHPFASVTASLSGG